MKANELRIGNWVTYARNWPYEIEDGQDIDAADIYSPIPLTEEWLINFGFEKVGINYQRGFLPLHTNKLSGTTDFLLNEPYSHIIHATKLESVHQLQNLYFALTNEELTIQQP